MQGFVVLEIHIRLERRFLCLCRRPVGFELVAAVALLTFRAPYFAPRSASSSDLCAPQRRNCPFQRNVSCCGRKYPLPVRGGIAGCCGAFLFLWVFPVPQNVGGSCLSRWLRQRCAPAQVSFFGDSRPCRVQTVGCFVRFSDIPFKLRRCPFLVGKLQAGSVGAGFCFCLCFPRRLFARLSGVRPVDMLQDALGCCGVLFPFCPGAWGSGGASAAAAGAAPPGMGCAACSGCCGAASFLVRSASLMRLLIRFFLPVAAFTSTAPSRVIFCVTFSRALYCFICLSLQSAPLQGAILGVYLNAYIMPVKLPCGCPVVPLPKRGQAQCRLSDSPP